MSTKTLNIQKFYNTNKNVSQGVLTRIIRNFEHSNPIGHDTEGVIKNYVYIDQKRIIA